METLGTPTFNGYSDLTFSSDDLRCNIDNGNYKVCLFNITSTIYNITTQHVYGYNYPSWLTL